MHQHFESDKSAEN